MLSDPSEDLITDPSVKLRLSVFGQLFIAFSAKIIEVVFTDTPKIIIKQRSSEVILLKYFVLIHYLLANAIRVRS